MRRYAHRTLDRTHRLTILFLQKGDPVKRLIVCADGTWGSPESQYVSNTLKVARAIASTSKSNVDDSRTEQVVFYDWGIGSEQRNRLDAISGTGIDKNILDCYRFLVHNYAIGDELYFFGFSRGAYTVRSLAGLIRNSGILKSSEAHRISDAYALYRRRGKASSPYSSKAAEFRLNHSQIDRTPIKFIGVWDTVGALGIPVPFWGSLSTRDFLFHDTDLSSTVKFARQALALDEQRADFQPTLWHSKAQSDLKQTWFAGSHSDIGGGNSNIQVSDIALAWIANEAKHCGLVFDETSHVAALLVANDMINVDEHGPLTNSTRGLYAMRPKIIRQIEGRVHRTAQLRWQADSDGYRKKATAINNLLNDVDQDWSLIDIEG